MVFTDHQGGFWPFLFRIFKSGFGKNLTLSNGMVCVCVCLCVCGYAGVWLSTPAYECMYTHVYGVQWSQRGVSNYFCSEFFKIPILGWLAAISRWKIAKIWYFHKVGGEDFCCLMHEMGSLNVFWGMWLKFWQNSHFKGPKCAFHEFLRIRGQSKKSCFAVLGSIHAIKWSFL